MKLLLIASQLKSALQATENAQSSLNSEHASSKSLLFMEEVIKLVQLQASLISIEVLFLKTLHKPCCSSAFTKSHILFCYLSSFFWSDPNLVLSTLFK